MELPMWRVDVASFCSVMSETSWCRQLRQTEMAQVVGIEAQDLGDSVGVVN
jgi:hypothetical protein